MGQVCSCQKEEDAFFQQQQRRSIKEIRKSIKSIQNTESVQTQDSSLGSLNSKGMQMFKSVFNGNLQRINDVENMLAAKRSKVIEFANQFMIQIALFEHPMNDFAGMDQKIYEGLIKDKVINHIRDYVENMFGELEGYFVDIGNMLTEMKENKSDAITVLQKSKDATELLDRVEAQSQQIQSELDKIKESWADALAKQE